MRGLLLLLAAGLLSGCAGLDVFKDMASSAQEMISGPDNADPPNELRPLEPSVRLTVLWDASVGDGTDGKFLNLVPAVTADVVYVADVKGEIQARDRLKGDKLWDTDTDFEFTAGPVVTGDKLLLGTADAELAAFSVTDGTLLWKTALSGEILALPRVGRNTVVVRTTDSRITALDLGSGATRWVHDRPRPIMSVRGLGSLAIAEDLVLDGFGGGKLVALSLTDGKPAWEANVAIPHGRTDVERLVEVNAEPLVRGDTAYLTGHQAGVAAVDLRDGSVLWRQEGMYSSQGLAADRKNLYISDNASDVWQLDLRTGGDLWKQAELHQRRLTVPATIGDHLVVGDLEGYVHALRKENGGIVGRVQVGSDPILAPPVVYGDVVYVYTAGGTLAALSLE